MAAPRGMRMSLWFFSVLGLVGLGGFAWSGLRGNIQATRLAILLFVVGVMGSALTAFARRRSATHAIRHAESTLHLTLITELGQLDDDALERIAKTRGSTGDVALSLLAERHRKRRM